MHFWQDSILVWFLRALDGRTCAADWLVPALAGEVVADCWTVRICWPRATLSGSVTDFWGEFGDWLATETTVSYRQRRNMKKRVASETRVWPSSKKKNKKNNCHHKRQVNVIAMPVFTFKRFETLLGDLRGEMATLLLPDVFCGTVLTVSPMAMVRGGVTGVLWVTTRPVGKRKDWNLDFLIVLIKQVHFCSCYKYRQKITSNYRSHWSWAGQSFIVQGLCDDELCNHWSSRRYWWFLCDLWGETRYFEIILVAYDRHWTGNKILLSLLGVLYSYYIFNK